MKIPKEQKEVIKAKIKLAQAQIKNWEKLLKEYK